VTAGQPRNEAEFTLNEPSSIASFGIRALLVVCCQANLVVKVTGSSNVSSAAFVWRSETGARYLTLVAKATFDLEPQRSALSETVEPLRGFEAEDAHSDRVPFKIRSEVLASGSAHAPPENGARFVARLVVGTIDKSVGVVGERHLTREGQVVIGPPASKVGLGWDCAARGPRNPVGRSNEVRDRQGRALLPSLLPPAEYLSDRIDGVPAIGFDAIPPQWSPRRELGGARGGPYQDADEMVLGNDLDPAFFQVASDDQQQSTTFEPDARIVLENLHPVHARLVTNLQPLYVSANIRSNMRDENRPMHVDTLLIDADSGRCTAVYRTAVALGARELPTAEIVTGPTPASVGRPERASGSRRTMPSLTPFTPSADSAELDVTHTELGIPKPQPALPFDQRIAAPREAIQPATGAVPFEVATDEAKGVDSNEITADSDDEVLRPGRPSKTQPNPPSPPPPPPVGPSSPSRLTLGASLLGVPNVTAPAKPPPASTLFRADRAPMSALEASNDAGTRDAKHDPLGRGSREPRFSEASIHEDRERLRLELLWSDEQAGERLAFDAPLMRFADKTPARRRLFGRPTTGEDASHRAQEIMDVLASAAPTNPTDFDALRTSTLRQNQGAAPPLCVVRGALVLLFDEQEALRATIGFASPFNRGDRNLKVAVEMGEAIADSEWSIGKSIESAISRIREALAKVARELTVEVQHSNVTRKLLEKRKFRTAVALGAEHLRADFVPAERATPVPMYLPMELKEQLPLYERLPITALVEVRTRQDEVEVSAHALSVLAIARDLDTQRRHPGATS